MDVLKMLPTKVVLAMLGGSILIWALMNWLCETERFGIKPDDFAKCNYFIPGWVALCLLVTAFQRKKKDKTDEQSK